MRTSFAGNVTTRSAADRRPPPARVPAERLLVETDAPYLAPLPERGHPYRPPFVAHTLSFVAALGASSAPSSREVQAERRRVFGCPWADSAQAPVPPSLRRMQQFGAAPDRDLGQNLLIDSNILGVIGRAAELEPARRGARDRRRPRRAVRVPGRAGRACARGRDRRAPGGRAHRRHRPAPQRHRPLGGRHEHGPAGAQPRAGEGRREPPLRHRGRGRCCGRSTSCTGAQLGRDGPARGRRRLAGLPGAAPTARPRCWPSSPARST